MEELPTSCPLAELPALGRADLAFLVDQFAVFRNVRRNDQRRIAAWHSLRFFFLGGVHRVLRWFGRYGADHGGG
jgi:hypothetical protein